MYWEFWIGGAALMAVAMGHWLLVGRLMAVSGRFTALVNSLRFDTEPEPEMSQEQLLEAMRAATREQFGDASIDDDAEDAQDAEDQPAPSPVVAGSRKQPQSTLTHALFLACLVVGGMLAAVSNGGVQPAYVLHSSVFPQVFGSDPLTSAVVLLAGGVLIGFGTRMSAGCTSGHGLCGVSRFQPGSLAATAAFFGAGIVVSLLLGGML